MSSSIFKKKKKKKAMKTRMDRYEKIQAYGAKIDEIIFKKKLFLRRGGNRKEILARRIFTK